MKNFIKNPRNLSIVTIALSFISILIFFISRMLTYGYSLSEDFLSIILVLNIASIGLGIFSNLIYFLKLTFDRKHNIKKLNVMYFVFLLIQMLYSLLWLNYGTIFITVIYIILIYFTWILFFKTKKNFLINPSKIFYIIVFIYLIALVYCHNYSYDEAMYKIFGIKHILVNLSYVLVYLHIIPSTKYFCLYAEYKMKRGESNE